MLTDKARYDALVARDPRFDGVFFVGVTSTGIYCRPICPSRTPLRKNCSFHASAAQAEAAGFRACFRCRPELAPGVADRDDVPTEVDAIDALVAAATRRIAEGALVDASIETLAAELGVSARHLRRAITARLGVSPLDLATSRRLGLAKHLLQDTTLPITQIAYASGFRSVRRFNAAFAQRMGMSPTKLRTSANAPARASAAAGLRDVAVTLRMDYRAPYAWTELLAFLRARAIPGVELVGDDFYARVATVATSSGFVVGTIDVRHAAIHHALALHVSAELVPHLLVVVACVRRQFDLDARPDVIDSVLARDPLLAPYIAARPGLRVPGAFDPFEAAIRALLGQQISVSRATTLAGRFAAAFGAPLVTVTEGLTTRFPSAAEVARLSVDQIATLGMPGARAAAIHTLAKAVATGAVRLDRTQELDAFVAALVELPGIGPWTAHYLAMRARHDPDAYPASDLGVIKALALPPRASEARAEPWRPYRAYAVMHLWSSLGGTDVDVRARDARDNQPARARPTARQGQRADRSAPVHARSKASVAGGTARNLARAGARRQATR